jgi:hypothetical protein
MHPSVLKLFRLFAWTAALGSFLLLTFGYAALPAEIPVTRWAMAAKTPLLVLRVPLINLLSLMLILILERSLVRAHATTPFRENAMMTLMAFYGTLGFKAFLETFEMINFPTVYAWIPWLLGIVVAAGLGLAGLTGFPFLRKTTAPRTSFTTQEKIVLALVVSGIVGFQILPFIPTGHF